MENQDLNRRSFLQTIGATGLLVALPDAAFGARPERGSIAHETAQSAPDVEAKPQYSINFAVCGMSHDHIYGMIGAIQRGGGTLVAAYGQEPEKLSAFTKRYPDVRMVTSEEAILNDKSIQLVLSSTIPNQRAPLGVRVMEHG